MKLYRLEVPIRNYHDDGIFFQQMYIIAEKCPLKQDWLDLAMEYHGKDLAFEEYDYNWIEVINSIQNTSEFPWLGSNMVMSTSHVKVGIYGEQPIILNIPAVKVLNEIKGIDKVEEAYSKLMKSNK